ncbi:MAG: ABC transporter ATP-binding protein [Anaerolineaceae bacterium]
MIKKLAAYIGKYKKYVLLSPILVFLDVLAELSMPLLMARIVDVGIQSKDLGYIVNIGLLMVLLAIVAIVFGIILMRYASVASQGFGANLRDALFKTIQSFSFKNIDKFGTSSLVTRLTNDVNNVQMTFMVILRMLLRAPMMMIVAFFFAYRINAQLSSVIAIAIPLLAIAVILIMRKASTLFTTIQEKIDQINKTLQENLIGIRVVKSFVRTDYEKSKFKKSNDELTIAGIRASKVVILNMPVMMLIMNGATLAIIWFGGNMVYTGGLGPGELISLISYIMQILMSVMMISMIFIMSARATASAKRILEVLETEVDITDKPEISAPLLPETNLAKASDGQQSIIQLGKVEFRNVSFKYNVTGSGEDVLQGISFIANPGEVIGLVGGTGAGKSTLVNLIPRLYDATEGEILVDDVDVRDFKLENLRREIGVVLQNNTLFSGTIRDNLLWGNENATQEEIETACKNAQAHDFIMSFPKGYETDLGQGGVNVSGGQKQRLCIARAMLKKPRILILDDSTSAVDSATEAKIRESFDKDFANTTIFIIAQRISSVRHADKIIILDDGKVVGMGTHEELLANNTVYQEINTSQQEGVLANG